MRYRKSIRPYILEQQVEDDNKKHSQKNSQHGSCNQVRHPQENDNKPSSDKKPKQ